MDATTAHYMFSNQLATPMGQGTAAHATLEAAETMAADLDGEVLDWDGLVAKHQAGELMVSAVAGMAGNSEAHVHAHEEGAITEHEAHQHDQMTVLGVIEDGGYSIELVAERPLHTGYNPVMIHVDGC